MVFAHSKVTSRVFNSVAPQWFSRIPQHRSTGLYLLPKSCKPKKTGQRALSFIPGFYNSRPADALRVLGSRVFNRYIPMIPKNDGDWAAISQAQPSFQQKGYDRG